jgi:hypothetical protein
MYSCDGIEGTWTDEPGELPVQGIEFTVDGSQVDMGGGPRRVLPGEGGDPDRRRRRAMLIAA